MWDELTILWNDLTILWNDLTIDWNDLTWNDLTMERNDRIPPLFQTCRQIKHVNNSPLRFFQALEQAYPPPRVVHYFFFALQQPKTAEGSRHLP